MSEPASPDPELEEYRAHWNRLAEGWRIQVGDDGDLNRQLNSDPVLWAFAGDVRGLRVLDAGCGTGYLSRQLHDRRAHVTGVDFSERMIELARAAYPDLDFRVDSCATLSSVPDASHDLVISNYVLMDTPDLEQTLRSFTRVLGPGGAAIVIFSHPCFPQSYATQADGDATVSYAWPFPYFSQSKQIDPPWGHFTGDFIWFHRPLSDYWKAFKAAGFDVEEFEEPRIAAKDHHRIEDEHRLRAYRERAYSVAFRLRKTR